ncbi:hypothetical protein GCM10007164_00340 [Luteimonas padinae]|uniref:DUF2207 domain-containing protein n=1 Tax=Luteimonas padinae TaxID=1714359 RepID=A0ABV6SS06_9GAMM|nr:DUF2207 domain-containing protein [Luteimonas padinae]GHD64533.1 hypothetical protein GCM10007164_00340 [Luteimonas padinae]
MNLPRMRLPALLPALLLAATLALLAATAPALAAERILAYDSVVEVRADGMLDVTEHIRVRAEGDAIRRGIYRDFPTRYKDRHGNNVVVGFEVLGVERDGRPEPWFTERKANGVRVNTGDDDLLPVPLDTAYTLRYRTTRQLGFFESHDELYWNAIGHGWAFPIEAGSVEVRLPTPVPADALEVDGWSGPQGAREQGFDAGVAGPGVARWTLTRPLRPREGLTIALSFPKGIVAQPSRADRIGLLLRDNLSLLIALAGLVVLLAYCLKRWHRVGRDPRPGVVIARYEPPRGESPAALRYLVRRGHDARGFSADLLACAVQGAVHIHRDEGMLGDRWRLERGQAAAAAPDNADERRLLDALLPGPGATLALEKKNATRIQGAMQAHARAFDARFQPAMFTHNAGSIGIAVAIFLVTFALAGVALVFTGGGAPWMLVPLGLMLATTIALAVLVGAPTAAGRALLDEIEGFRRYLGVAEQDDIARVPGPAAAGAEETEPALDAGRFERLLPYAVALDVEDAWTKKFTLAVGSAAAAAATAAITWYHGASPGNMGQLASAVGGALSSKIASSATPPGSSSSGGGGGFSGGGGGGGGGGGR